ncbi:MAG TPA: sulfite exporter TauE/SafE family protein [Chitinophagaceae bacterium]|nr:sulfite exporter TauE/SafE family protein [Chitinophagaceae bacterium]
MTIQIVLTVIIIGLAAGMLSGLVGVGGGIIMVPALVFFLSYNQHQAQGTSLGVLTLPVVIIASLYYYYQCKKMGTPMDLRVIGLLAVGFVVGAYFGSKLAISLTTDTLKKTFAVVLFYTAFKMLGWDTLFMKWVKGIFS